jgi:hypothetical protein
MNTTIVSNAFSTAEITHSVNRGSLEYDDHLVINDHLRVQIGRDGNYLCVLLDGCEIGASAENFGDSKLGVIEEAIETVEHIIQVGT